MLSIKEIQNIFNALLDLKLGYRFGYAGSYARGRANEKSDLDIIVAGEQELPGDDYFKVYNVLKNVTRIKFDIVDFTALKEDDDKMDRMLLDMGLSINDSSAYKTIEKETVWMN